MRFRGDYIVKNEQLFILSDHSPLEAPLVRKLLQKLIQKLKLNPKVYCFQGLRVGRVTDMVKWGVSLEVIKRLG